MRYIRTAGIGACAGLGAGLLWGIGARLAMRIMAIVAERPAEFSIQGSLLILLLGAFIGIPAGLLFVAIRRYLPGRGQWKALSFGLLTLLVLGYPFYTGPLRDESGLGHRALAFVMFEGLLVLFGMAVAMAAAWLERMVPPARSRLATVVNVGTLVVPCGIEAAIVALIVFNPFE
jgi:hypothetical protein